ncbi:phage tail protein [Desulfoluna sp.]|uniref:phage tail protein n=1 Tax=Desulfoluna sp. TaxID=2045199 RepID=UPI00262759D7|nr:phage tail protein [Desulfoluna sp.]
MKKLSALAAHLLALPGITRDQMTAFADQGKLSLTGKDLGHGLEVGRFRYDAVISIDRCPSSIAELLLSFLVVWLAKNDVERFVQGLADPDVDVSLSDDNTVDVEISVEFDEALVIVPDPEGPLAFEGAQWRVDDAGINVAESLAGLEAV